MRSLAFQNLFDFVEVRKLLDGVFARHLVAVKLSSTETKKLRERVKIYRKNRRGSAWISSSKLRTKERKRGHSRPTTLIPFFANRSPAVSIIALPVAFFTTCKKTSMKFLLSIDSNVGEKVYFYI